MQDGLDLGYCAAKANQTSTLRGPAAVQLHVAVSASYLTAIGWLLFGRAYSSLTGTVAASTSCAGAFISMQHRTKLGTIHRRRDAETETSSSLEENVYSHVVTTIVTA